MKYLIIVLLIIKTYIVFSQNIHDANNDFNRIILNTYINNKGKFITTETSDLLEIKMNQMVTNYGMAGSSINPRFVFTNKIAILNKEIITGPPQMMALYMEITFYIGDAIDNRIYSNLSIKLKGVGETETKAGINAIRKLKTKTDEIELFFKNGKEKIISYYINNCELILAQSLSLEKEQKYNEALYTLNAVPNTCKDCYNKCTELSAKIYQNMINIDCDKKLFECKSIWAVNNTNSSAKTIISILNTVNFESNCYNEIDSLISIIQKKVSTDQKKAEAEEIKRYKEQKLAEKIALEREYDLNQKRIQAYKELATEYYRNQPTKIIYNIIW